VRRRGYSASAACKTWSPCPSDNIPLTRDRILVIAEDVIRRFGPDRAAVVHVARALGVSHAGEWADPGIYAAFNDVWQLGSKAQGIKSSRVSIFP
jgi:hypothetical protein